MMRSMNTQSMHTRFALALLLAVITTSALAKSRKAVDAPWQFVVSGDSRNCGDVVMPSIATGAHANKAVFYWHLGDLRAIYDFDEDYRSRKPQAPIIEYLETAWLDFQRSQIEPFGDTPFFIGIGNHETIPPKTREEFTLAFADWLNTPEIRTQRLKDDPHDHQVRTYYHWIRDGVDFINLDNATPDQFDAAQMKWIKAVLKKDLDDAAIRAVVVGMHEALPESIARGHSMSDTAIGQASGIEVYNELLAVRRSKPVYILASHSHYVMEGVFETSYWHEHGGVLPGWIIGTAGAVRYPLPPEATRAKFAKTHVYGYLLGTVSPRSTHTDDPVQFSFQELSETDTPPEVLQRYGSDLVRSCYQENARQ
jgi:Calcineurin-like phosphoesterase